MEQKRNKQYVLLIYVVLALATLIAFEPIRHNEFVDYDDNTYVTQNPRVEKGLTPQSIIWAFTSTVGSNWHPLTWLSHMLDCQLFGLNPLGHHLTSLLFHIASTLLLFRILKKTTGEIWPSAFVAAAFAMHPLHVESVAWAAERKDVLSGFFFMLTIAFYIRYAQQPNIKKYLLVIFALCLGLLAKPMLVTLPFVLLLLDYWPLQRFQWGYQNDQETPQRYSSTNINCKKSSLWRLGAEKIPLFVVITASSVITFIAQQTGGAMPGLEQVPIVARIANALASYVEYIAKMIYPSRLAVLYPFPLRGLPLWQPIVSFVALVVITVGVIYAARRRRYLAVGWLWYVGTLVPVIGLVQVGAQAIADRYTYLPSIGFFIIVAWGAAELVAKWRYQKIVLSLSAGLILTAMLFCTRNQLRYWQNSSTLFGHAIDVTKNNYVMQNSYGALLTKDKQIEEAAKHFEQSLKINPLYKEALLNLGRVSLERGDIDEAIRKFEKVLQIYPDYHLAYFNLGMAKTRQKKYTQAIKYFKEGLRLKPDSHQNHDNLAKAYFIEGKINQAVSCWRKALELAPDYVDALNNLAWIYAAHKQTPFYNPREALPLAQRACKLTEHNRADFMDTLAVSYAATGNFAKAIETAEKAMNLARETDEKDLVDEIQSRLQLYKAGQPYTEPSPKTTK